MIYASSAEVGIFELRNYETLRNLVAKHDIPCEWISLPGCHAFMSKSMFETAVEHTTRLDDEHPDLASLISVVYKESTSPSLADLRIPEAEGAIVQKNAASLWPYKLVCWLLESLLATNTPHWTSFNLQTNTAATRLQKLDDGWIVHTSRGMIAAKNVLLATNAYTSHLLPQFSDLIVPVRGEMSALLPPRILQKSPLPSSTKPLDHSYILLGDDDRDEYLIQRPTSTTTTSGGELMYGGGREYAQAGGVGISDDSAIDPPAAAYLRYELNEALDLQNDDRELKATHEWTGIMGFSKDEHPWVGPVDEELGGGAGLWISAGFTGHGMPNACLCAKAVVDMMMGSEDVDLPALYKLQNQRAEIARGLAMEGYFRRPEESSWCDREERR